MQMKHSSVPEKGNSTKKKILLIIVMLIACLILGAIAVSAVMKPKVTGVKSLAAANLKAQSKVKSYHMDGDVDMDISLDNEEYQSIMEKLNLKIPVKMTLSADAGSETAHVITDASVIILGESIPLQTSESYLDMKNRAVYSKTGDPPKWKKSGKQAEQLGFRELVGGIAIIGKTVLENAAYNETEEFYTLTIPAEKAGDLIKDLHLLDRVDLGIADIRDITVEGGEILYNVDKTTLLVSSVELKEVDCRGKGTYENKSVDLKFLISGSFLFSRYNELEESEYTIPAEVTE